MTKKQNQETERELTAVEIAERLGVSLRTAQRYLSSRPDIFPNARQAGPNYNSPYVTTEADVIAFEKKYPKINK